ncbi:FecCD family ABC transporter permease [Spirochaeta africana]|uniref:ABC-type Fe3+-siderophore transport system, permease component n=1 Tax=Spirochaeta africana (strain ATCC 700263 / DSM 8902 / Z-7692) TaxID=889378 RepID=H9UL90_SPIAZ|nr:iron ABC transporter permease [Spirochaeta africana]AFG38283.1 ABC-type Fe3+-siderophore transport system, permease component [Spirochaeta africana DSM 8902]
MTKRPELTRTPLSASLLLALLSAVLATLLAAVLWGAVSLSAGDVMQALRYPPARLHLLPPELRRVHAIVWYIRLPRAITAATAGAALAVSGAAVQGLFRNPLASPDVLGISAGSSLGAVIAIVTGAAALHPLAISGAAFLGAIGAAGLVYTIATRPGGTHLLYLVLAGLAVSSLLSGMVSGILIMAEEYAVSQFIFWTMGGLDGASWARILPPLPLIIILSLILIALGQTLNLLSLGEEHAYSLGLPVEHLKIAILLLASTLTALAVAAAGPIAFVGLMVPHGVRLLTGPNHRRLLPLSGISGALFLLLADLAARTLLAPREIKTGIITALIGGPYFIFLILRHRRKGAM